MVEVTGVDTQSKTNHVRFDLSLKEDAYEHRKAVFFDEELVNLEHQHQTAQTPIEATVKLRKFVSKRLKKSTLGSNALAGLCTVERPLSVKGKKFLGNQRKPGKPGKK